MSRQNLLLSRVYPANSTHTPPFRAAGTPCMTCRQTHATPRAVDRSPHPLLPPFAPFVCLGEGAASSQGTSRSLRVTSDVVQPCPLFPFSLLFPFLPRPPETPGFPRCETPPPPFPRPRSPSPRPPPPPSLWLCPRSPGSRPPEPLEPTFTLRNHALCQ